MNTSTWKNLTEIVLQVVKDAGVKNNADVMKVWNESKSKVSELLTNSKAKKTTTPGAPKHPKSNYIFFCNAKRDELKKQKPNLSATELTTELGAMWKGLSEAERAPYTKLSQEDKLRYAEAMKSFKTENPSDATESKTEKKKQPTPYNEFCSQKRSEVKSQNPTDSGVEINRKLGKMWKELSDAQKKSYSSASASVAESAHVATPTPVKAPVKTESKKVEKEPVKKVEPVKETKKETKKVEKTPGFLLFEQEMEDELEEVPKRSRPSELLKRWNALSARERQDFEEQANMDDETDEDELEDEDE